jgi:hypothetical protein
MISVAVEKLGVPLPPCRVSSDLHEIIREAGQMRRDS